MIDNGTKKTNNEENITSFKTLDHNGEKTSTKVSEKENSDNEKFSDGHSEDESDKESESSHECNCNMSHGEENENNYVQQTENTQIRRKIPDSHFYEKQLLAKKEMEKKYELIRKRKEEEVRSRAKPVIDEGSKKIMEKKQGFVKPIYLRAKDVEESKKNKIANIKKGIDEKKAKKEEDDHFKSKYISKNKHYNEKEFEEWRNNQLKWDSEKKKKIQHIKEMNQKSQLETLSKFYHPSIDKKSENLVRSKVLKGNDNGRNVFEKLYSQNEVRQKKLIQKTIEALPNFKPHINKKVPSYFRSRPNSHLKYSTDFFPSESKISSTAKNNKNLSYIEVSSTCKTEGNTNYNTYSNVSQTERTQKSKAMNNSTIETFNNPIILSNSEDEESDNEKEKEKSFEPLIGPNIEPPVETTVAENHEDIVSKYKKALESSTRTPSIITKTINEIKANEISNLSMQSKNTYIKTDNSKLTVNKVVPKSKIIPGLSTVYSSDKNKEKIEIYNQKIAALLSCLKKTEKKK